MEASAEGEANPVLEARKKRLAQNRDYLESLGLAGPVSPLANAPVARKPKPKREKRGPPPVPSRRSARISGMAADHLSIQDSELSDDSDSVQPERTPPSRPRRQPVHLEAPHAQVELKRPKPVSDGLKSTKKVNARVDKMSDEWVGKLFEPEDGAFKAYVMNSVAEEPISFSKYSGIQYFKNCTVLFVNVGGTDYRNVFHFKGDNVTFDWFAQDRMHRESPEVIELSTPGTPIFLFLRFVAAPYLCCGPLSAASSDLDAAPVRIEFTIRASERLKQVPAFIELTRQDSPL